MTLAREEGSEALVKAGFALVVMVISFPWSQLAGSLLVSLELSSTVLVLSPLPLGLPLLGFEYTDPASSRMGCLGRGEWMLSVTPPEPVIASSTLPGEITRRLGD